MPLGDLPCDISRIGLGAYETRIGLLSAPPRLQQLELFFHSEIMKIREQLKRYHNKIWLRRLPLPVIIIIVVVSLVNAGVWAGIGIVLVRCSLLLRRQ